MSNLIPFNLEAVRPKPIASIYYNRVDDLHDMFTGQKHPVNPAVALTETDVYAITALMKNRKYGLSSSSEVSGNCVLFYEMESFLEFSSHLQARQIIQRRTKPKPIVPSILETLGDWYIKSLDYGYDYIGHQDPDIHVVWVNNTTGQEVAETHKFHMNGMFQTLIQIQCENLKK